MTRKDYEKIAAAIQSERKKADKLNNRNDWETREVEKAWRIACESIALNMVDVLSEDNPRFDREKFMKACGL